MLSWFFNIPNYSLTHQSFLCSSFLILASRMPWFPSSLCREKERDVWASCLLLGVSSDGFNYSWVSFAFFLYALPLPMFSCIVLILDMGMPTIWNVPDILLVWLYNVSTSRQTFLWIMFQVSSNTFYTTLSVLPVLLLPPILCLSANWMHFYFAFV